MSVTSKQLHNVFIAATHEVRRRLAAADLGGFTLQLKASGRTMTDQDEIKLEYILCAPQYGPDVRGNDLERVITEVIRRSGWDETNAPQALPAPANAVAK